jgi:hypothetical protein
MLCHTTHHGWNKMWHVQRFNPNITVAGENANASCPNETNFLPLRLCGSCTTSTTSELREV